MKKVLLFAVLLCTTLSVAAQNADSVRFATAQHKHLALPKGAEGYTIERVNLFNSVQTISVIKYSPKRFRTAIVQPDKLIQLATTAAEVGADFGVNAGYWDVRIDKPSTFLVLNGKEIAATADFEKERVDGVVCIAKRKIVIDHCKAGAETPYTTKYNNILAAGPVLIDEGESVDHSDYTNGMVDSAGGKPVGAFYTYTRRHPRTAMGCDKSGNIYLVVVGGRSRGNAEGVTIAELTKVCEWLGMRDAINLDGGGSSTMWSRSMGVVNYPCGNKKFDHEGDRNVSSCIVVKRR
jgi:exopolysaccharide biosynthesis protein